MVSLRGMSALALVTNPEPTEHVSALLLRIHLFPFKKVDATLEHRVLKYGFPKLAVAFEILPPPSGEGNSIVFSISSCGRAKKIMWLENEQENFSRVRRRKRSYMTRIVNPVLSVVEGQHQIDGITRLSQFGADGIGEAGDKQQVLDDRSRICIVLLINCTKLETPIACCNVNDTLGRTSTNKLNSRIAALTVEADGSATLTRIFEIDSATYPRSWSAFTANDISVSEVQ